ncbi:Heterokaryon incompatibility protein (HET) domain containing protein [Rhypophila decipiens]
MRLLNASSLELKEFGASNIPPYAILSHTWGEEEVLFDDIQNGSASLRKAYTKVTGCCRKATEDGFEWVWIDTGCIDKTSSAELSEAINSMYRWYVESIICYAYLEDVAFLNFSNSRWFTRRWTLQGLVAPKVVEFYTSGSLASRISTITGIPVRILNGECPSTCSIAERMSWAVEDLAYCLLGLFGINMPLLYGEGAKSFTRLQEQILKQEEDYSLFAWTLQRDCRQSLTGFLASSPSEFAEAVPRNLQLPTLTAETHSFDQFGGSGADLYPGNEYQVLCTKRYESLRKHDFHTSSATNIPMETPQLISRGLRISLPIRRSSNSTLPTIAWIYCEIDNRLLCVLLKPCSTSNPHLLGRHMSPWLITVNKSLRKLFVLAELLLHLNGMIGEDGIKPSLFQPLLSSWGRVQVVVPETDSYTAYVVSAYPVSQWSINEFFFRGDPKVIGIVMFECAHGRQFSRFEVCCGILNDQPWCSITEDSGSRLGDEVDDLSAIFEQQSLRDVNSFSQFSDRGVKLCVRLPQTVLSAAIRRSPATQGSNSAYTLRVSACALDRCADWVSLYISEAKKSR